MSKLENARKDLHLFLRGWIDEYEVDYPVAVIMLSEELLGMSNGVLMQMREEQIADEIRIIPPGGSVHD